MKPFRKLRRFFRARPNVAQELLDEYRDLMAVIEKGKAEVYAQIGQRPLYAYMHPKDARGLVVICGLVVRTSPEQPRGTVLVACDAPSEVRKEA